MIVARISDHTGDIRSGFYFVMALLLVPIPILTFFVNVPRGRAAAEKYAKEKALKDGSLPSQEKLDVEDEKVDLDKE